MRGVVTHIINCSLPKQALKSGMSNYISSFYVDVISYPRPNGDAGLANL